MPPPRSSTFSTVREYRGIEIGGRQLLLLATLEKLNLIWLVPEILGLVISCQSLDASHPPFLTLSHSSSLFLALSSSLPLSSDIIIVADEVYADFLPLQRERVNTFYLITPSRNVPRDRLRSDRRNNSLINAAT